MTRKHGKHSRLYMSEDENTDPVLVLSMAEFNFDDDPDDVPTTCFEDGNKTSLQGYPGGSGTFAGFWDTEEFTLWKARASVGGTNLKFYPDYAGNPDRYISCLASISCSVKSSSTDAVRVSGRWSAKGTIVNTLDGDGS